MFGTEKAGLISWHHPRVRTEDGSSAACEWRITPIACFLIPHGRVPRESGTGTRYPVLIGGPFCAYLHLMVGTNELAGFRAIGSRGRPYELGVKRTRTLAVIRRAACVVKRKNNIVVNISENSTEWCGETRNHLLLQRPRHFPISLSGDSTNIMSGHTITCPQQWRRLESFGTSSAPVTGAPREVPPVASCRSGLQANRNEAT